MPIDTREIIDAISILTDQRNMRVALGLGQAVKETIICATVILAALLLGPVGFAIGGVAAMAVTKGKFKSVAEIIRDDLTERQRQELVERVVDAVRQVDITDIAMLAPLMMGNDAVQQAVLSTVTSFVTNELRLEIVD